MGLSHTNFVWFMGEAAGYITDHPEQRLGQAYYNIFRIMYPTISMNKVAGTFLDCFDDNRKLPAFLKWVQATLDRLDETQ